MTRVIEDSCGAPEPKESKWKQTYRGAPSVKTFAEYGITDERYITTLRLLWKAYRREDIIRVAREFDVEIPKELHEYRNVAEFRRRVIASFIGVDDVKFMGTVIVSRRALSMRLPPEMFACIPKQTTKDTAVIAFAGSRMIVTTMERLGKMYWREYGNRRRGTVK